MSTWQLWPEVLYYQRRLVQQLRPFLDKKDMVMGTRALLTFRLNLLSSSLHGSALRKSTEISAGPGHHSMIAVWH